MIIPATTTVYIYIYICIYSLQQTNTFHRTREKKGAIMNQMRKRRKKEEEGTRNAHTDMSL